jgi:hypothetical protein
MYKNLKVGASRLANFISLKHSLPFKAELTVVSAAVENTAGR